MTNNPRVNRCLADKMFDHMDHALGRHFDPADQTFRNYFATDAGSALAQEFDASPWWKLGRVSDGMAYYHVTTAGIYALKGYLAKNNPIHLFVVSFNGFSSNVTAETAGKARYADFLDRTDVYPDLTFIEFSKHASVRRVA